MSYRVGVGLVGAGMWGKRVAAAVGRTESLRLVSCYTRSEESRRATAESVSCRAAGSLEELLDDPEVEGVLVLTPNHAHREIAEAAASRGKHVLVEKPIADTLESAEAIVDACERGGVVLFVAHCFRRLGAARATASLIADGSLGRVVLAEAHFSLQGTFKPGNWRSSRRTLVGGPLIQMGVHHSDTLQGWFGPAKTVSGSLTHLAARADVDDIAVALIEHATGTRSIISCSYVSPKSYGFRLYGTEANLDYRTEMSLWPQQERMDSETTLNLERRDGTRSPVEFETRDMLVNELEEFARCITSGERPETGGREGIDALQVVLAAVASSATGSVVAIDRRRTDNST